MKKIFTLAAAFLATALSFQAAADSWVVTTSAEFTTALGKLSRVEGAMDTIFVAPESADVVISSGTYKAVPTAGKFWVIGTTDFRPVLQLRFDAEAGTEPGSDLSMIFENLNIQFTSGNTATSGQIFYFNGKYVDMDTLAFRNCDFTNYPRTVYRSVPPKDDEGNYMEGGSINYFEMVDCRVYNANITSGNNWPCIYFGQVPIDVVFRNNTFYDLPYLKQIFTMNYITEETGRTDGTVTFENNTVMVGASGFSVIDVSNYMGMSSTFNINNNLFLYPDWTDDLNVEAASQPTILKCTYGMISAANNVIEGFRNWNAGNNKDADTGDYTWLIADTTENYTMATAELAWDDFYDRYNKDFSLLKGYKIYTAGADAEGNPTFIGAEEWYLDEFPVKAAVNVSVEGSTTATVTIQPEKAIYFVGDEITISLDLHNGLNTFLGWSDGVNDLTRTITLEGDINLTANVVSENYELLWDFCNIISNNQKISSPMIANHYANTSNIGILGVRYFDGSAYADTTQFDSRNNKSYPYNGGENALFLASLRRSLATDLATNPGYHYIMFNTKGLTGVKVSSTIMAENQANKTQLVQYSLDGATNWTTLDAGTVTMDSIGQGWIDVVVELPAEAENQQSVYVRWIGDATSEIIQSKSFDPEGSMAPYEYMFLANVKVTAAAGGSAIEESAADEVAAVIYQQNGNQVTVSNVAAAEVAVYNMAGAQVATAAVVNGSATVTLSAGTYLVVAGDASTVMVVK